MLSTKVFRECDSWHQMSSYFRGKYLLTWTAMSQKEFSRPITEGKVEIPIDYFLFRLKNAFSSISFYFINITNTASDLSPNISLSPNSGLCCKSLKTLLSDPRLRNCWISFFITSKADQSYFSALYICVFKCRR